MNKKEPDEKPKISESPWRAAGLVSAIGVELAMCILLGYFGGTYLSQLTDGSKIWMASGVLIGLLIGIAGAVMIIKRLLEEQQ